MPIWSAPPETEETKKQRIKKESESNTNEDALEAVIDKSKLAASSSTDHRNLRRKSSNIRGDVEGLHIHDQNKEASGKLEQVHKFFDHNMSIFCKKKPNDVNNND